MVDGGVGREIKRRATYLIEKRLIEDEAFFKKWIGEGLTASEKRVFVTHIGYQAHKDVMETLDVEKIATRTGCMMTVDGSGDDLILPQGCQEYSFSPSDALLPAQNAKGDYNDVAKVTDAGVVGELEEVVEDEDDGEEQEESSDEEEEPLCVESIISCQCVGPTVKYLCTYKGFEADDTSLEPASNVQPKSVLLAFQEAGKANGTFPPIRPSPKRKAATKAKKPRGKRSKPSRASSRHHRANVVVSDSDDTSDEELRSFFKPKVDQPAASSSQGQAASSSQGQAVDLCGSEEEAPKAPELVAGICDYGCPNPDECLLKDATGRFCDALGCTKRVHHLCLIEHAQNPKKPQWYKKFNDNYPSGAMCKRCLVAKVAADGRKQIRV